jgi:hypothetical protein
MSGTSGQRQTGTAMVATGTTTLAGLPASASTGHLATRNHSGFRLVGAPIGSRDIRVLDRGRTALPGAAPGGGTPVVSPSRRRATRPASGGLGRFATG